MFLDWLFRTGWTRSVIKINGKQYSGRTVSIMNSRVVIDGKEISKDDTKPTDSILKIEVTGDLANLETDASVECGNVRGTVQAGGSVKCGDVGDIVQAGGSVRCGKIGGSVMAGGSVSSN